MKRIFKKWFVICAFVFAAFAAAESVYAVSIDVETGHTGNIYNDRDEKTMTIKYSDVTEATNATVNYEIKNEKSVVVSSGSKGESLSVGKNVTTLSLPNDLGYGAFYLNLTVKDASGTVIAEKSEIPFSQILERKDGRLNEKVGVDAHFSWGWDEKAGSEVARKAGFSTIRDSLAWQDSETAKGVYTFPQRHNDILDAMLNDGIEAQYDLLYGNSLYGFPTGGGKCELPSNDTERAAFAEYAYNVVKNSNGKIKYLRVWNEPNHPTSGDSIRHTEANAQLYMQLLKTVYEKIKPDYPDVQIGAFSTSDVDKSVEFITWAFNWCTNKGLTPTDYFDYVSFHTYGIPIGLSYGLEASDFQALRSLIDSYEGGTDKEIWCNEYGFYDETATNGWGTARDPYTKAAYTSVLTAQMLAGKYTDKCMIYLLADKSTDLTDLESVFGLTRSYDSEVAYAAKPVYVAMTAFNSLTCGYDECTASTSGGVSQYDFKNTEDFCDVSMLWSNNGSENTVTVNPNGRSVTFRDMYGNVIPVNGGQVTANSDGTYSATVPSLAPMYVIYRSDDVPTYYEYIGGDITAKIVNVDKTNNLFKISGRVAGGGDLIAIVYPTEALPNNSEDIVPTEGMVYCNQFETGYTGWFSAEFYLPTEYEYFTLVLDNENLSERCLIDFSAGRLTAEVVSIDKITNRFRISGKVTGGGDVICAVYPTEKLPADTNDIVPTEDMVYCNQFETGQTGEFSAEFSLPREYSDFTAVLANENLSENTLINFSAVGFTARITAVDEDENRFKLSGTIDGGDLICIVYPTEALPANTSDIVPTEDMVYCNQLEIDQTGEFSAEFNLTDEYEYFTAVIAHDNLDETYLINFNGKSVYNIIAVKQNGNDIRNILDIDNSQTIDVYIKNYSVAEGITPMLICAAYDTDGNLTACEVYEPEINGSDAQVIGVDIDMSGAANVKVYLWDRQRLCPIREYKNIR